jgi:DNA-binding NarL/FixJ family response regulator
LARIFLAEDNLTFRRLLKGLVEAQAGWQVCGETGDGLEAVDKVVELKPDVVVLDFAIARLNGLQVAAKISSACPGLPIILHTVHVFPAMVAEAMKVGIREVVGKNETAERLLAVIAELVEKKPPGTARLLNNSPRPKAGAVENGNDKPKLPEPN